MLNGIYEPSDDSYFFVEFLESYLKEHEVSSYLDMGTGTGILSECVSGFVDGNNILAVDVNPLAVSKVRSKGFRCVESDLFENVEGRFDLVTFNAPYLPRDVREPLDSALATTGGERGDEIALRFLKKVGEHLNEGGKVFLLVSSLTPLERFGDFEIVARKKIFMEELMILEVGFL